MTASETFELRAISKNFGGHQALRDVSVTVSIGEIVGLVGPNGSGKSTLLSIAMGTLGGFTGSVWLGSRRIDRLRSERRAEAGLGRSNQQPRAFRDLSVLDNMLIARRHSEAMSSARNRAIELLDRVDLAGHRDAPAGALSGGQQKLLDVARVMMRKPKFILLDEPAAGVNPALGRRLLALITLASETAGLLLVSHNVDAIRAVCQRVVCLSNGEKIADGPTADVLNDERVIDAYVGHGLGRSL